MCFQKYLHAAWQKYAYTYSEKFAKKYYFSIFFPTLKKVLQVDKKR